MTFQNLSRSRLLSPNHSQGELNSSHAKCDVWNRSHFARTVRAARSHLTLRSSAIKELALNCFKRRILHGSNAINWVWAMQDATFETGLRCDKPQLKTKIYRLRYKRFCKISCYIWPYSKMELSIYSQNHGLFNSAIFPHPLRSHTILTGSANAFR